MFGYRIFENLLWDAGFYFSNAFACFTGMRDRGNILPGQDPPPPCQGTQAGTIHQNNIYCIARVHYFDKVYETVQRAFTPEWCTLSWGCYTLLWQYTRLYRHSFLILGLLFFREILCYVMVYLPIKLYTCYLFWNSFVIWEFDQNLTANKYSVS